MEFEYFREPIEENEEPGSELENMIEIEITIFEKEPILDEPPEHDIINEDYMQKELEILNERAQDANDKMAEMFGTLGIG